MEERIRELEEQLEKANIAIDKQHFVQVVMLRAITMGPLGVPFKRLDVVAENMVEIGLPHAKEGKELYEAIVADIKESFKDKPIG